MRKTIQIGNLALSMDDRDLARLFAPHGAVHRATVSTRSNSGQSTGVGFVEMESADEGESAIAVLNGRAHCGRVLTVCWSKVEFNPDTTPREMFGPMNMAGAIDPPPETSERRGLP